MSSQLVLGGPMVTARLRRAAAVEAECVKACSIAGAPAMWSYTASVWSMAIGVAEATVVSFPPGGRWHGQREACRRISPEHREKTEEHDDCGGAGGEK